MSKQAEAGGKLARPVSVLSVPMSLAGILCMGLAGSLASKLSGKRRFFGSNLPPNIFVSTGLNQETFPDLYPNLNVLLSTPLPHYSTVRVQKLQPAVFERFVVLRKKTCCIFMQVGYINWCTKHDSRIFLKRMHFFACSRSTVRPFSCKIFVIDSATSFVEPYFEA